MNFDDYELLWGNFPVWCITDFTQLELLFLETIEIIPSAALLNTVFPSCYLPLEPKLQTLKNN